jgi:hypothetical protein
MSCDPAQLAANAQCLFCAFNGPELKAIAIRLLCAIRDGETMACDSASLADAAKCIECGVPQGMLDAVIVSILCQIASNTSIIAGQGAVLCQNGPPTVTPTVPCSVDYNTATGTIWVWDGTNWI